MAKIEQLKEKDSNVNLYPVTLTEAVYDKSGKSLGEILLLKDTPIVAASETELAAEPGKYYRFDEPVNSLAVTLPQVSGGTTAKGVVLSFTTGDAPSVTISAVDEVAYFFGYSIEPNTTYELNIMFNGLKWIVAYGVVE